MLQSEFYDRTKVSLSGEEYGEVENIYNRVQMNKDEFCKLWMKCRDNKIIKELVQTCMGYEKKCAALEKVEKEFEVTMAKELAAGRRRLEELGRKVLLNLGDDNSHLYDVLEEEFTLDFIVKVKLEENLDLEDHERKHLLGKL